MSDSQLKLHKGEDILFTTKNPSAKAQIIIILLPFIFIIVICVPLYSLISLMGQVSGFTWTIGVIAIIFVLFILSILIFSSDIFFRQVKSTYYITSKRIVQILGKSVFYQKEKRKIIKIENVAYVQTGRSYLEIVQKGPSGELHYWGDEKSKKRFIQRGTNCIKFFLSGEKGKQLKQEIKDLLLEKIPLSKHPLLDNIYLSKTLDLGEKGIIKKEIKDFQYFQEISLDTLTKIESRNLKIMKNLKLWGILIIILYILFPYLLRVFYLTGVSGNYENVLIILFQFELYWMISFLVLWALLNIILWYKLSSLLLSKAKIYNKQNKVDKNELNLCTRCGYIVSKGIYNNNQNTLIQPVKFFGITGYYCKRCYKKNTTTSMATLILLPITFFILYYISLIFLYSVEELYLPHSIYYLMGVIFPFVIATSFFIITHIIYSSILFFKRYNVFNFNKHIRR